ncbi:hypothetical protein PRIPAC_71027 [Pristionchus pacificus]|uniref:Large ribosomal subunit protein uL23m n=1 Tax=Pristionchus pacificus TaxID=54126 RepID=A0A2A6CZM0_PRIPA|nr:hypothetical protein PRIPAC_71027 [Pristionchus pacificus]|eukprot:PDM83599.1 ribosomal protein [Pristionchus pacificus]
MYDSLRSESQESISMLRTIVRNDHPSLNDTVEKAVLAPAEALVSQARITFFPRSPFFIPFPIPAPFSAPMASRIARLWQLGGSKNLQLSLFTMLSKSLAAARLLDGRGAAVVRSAAPDCAEFEMDPRMSKHDVREYLEKLYQAPVRSVRTEVQMGEIVWNSKTDYQYKKAMWKEEDKKYVYVFMVRSRGAPKREKNYKFVFPIELTFSESEEVREIE